VFEEASGLGGAGDGIIAPNFGRDELVWGTGDATACRRLHPQWGDSVGGMGMEKMRGMMAEPYIV